MSHPIRDHLIEEILLNAHIHRELGVDVIEEYFLGGGSLDHITVFAKRLLDSTAGENDRELIRKNLSECIVVKAQRDRQSITGVARKFFTKIGLPLGRSGDIRRAEQLIRNKSL